MKALGLPAIHELDPREADAYVNRGVARRRLGEAREAIQDFTRAIEIRPDYVSAWMVRGITRRTLGDLQGAVEDLSRALELMGPEHSVRGAVESALAKAQADLKEEAGE